MSKRLPDTNKETTENKKDNIGKYAELIKRYLKNQALPLSENDIVKEVLKINLDTDDDLPSSEYDLERLAEVRGSLRTLVSQGKVFQTLVLDPQTKEQTPHYIWEKGEN
jgi:hypothetical protein